MAPSRAWAQVDLLCERSILVLVSLVVLGGPLAFGCVPPLDFLGMAALAVLALGLWAVRLWIQRPFRLLCPPAAWAALVFLLYAIVRCQDRFVLLAYPARTELIQVIIYASLFFAIVNNLHRRESATVIACCLIAVGLGLSWVAFFQVTTKATHIWGWLRPEQYGRRASGTYSNPDHLAALLGMAIPMALSFGVLSRFKPALKVLCIYAALCMIGGVGLTVSRGGILAMGAMLGAFCLVLVTQRGYRLAALAVLVFIGIGAYALLSQFDSVRARFDAPTYSTKPFDVRTGYWPAAIHIFEDHPFWGGGPAHFDSEYAKYRAPEIQIRPVYAHNDYLNTLSDWGGVGFAIILATLGFIGYGVYKTWPKQSAEIHPAPALRSDRAAFLLGASLGLGHMLLHSIVDFNMHIPANAAIVVILMALMTGYWRFVTERYWFDPRWLGRIALTCAILLSMAWLCIQEIRRGREAWWLHEAENPAASPQQSFIALKTAYEAEPKNYVTPYNIGETYRLQSLEANPGYEALARQAMSWYGVSMKLNPLDAYVPMRYGMCLDWIGQTNQATPYFLQAENLDPNNTHVAYFVGRHYVELHDYPGARRWFQHSIDIQWNDLAFSALTLLDERMKDPYGLDK
jgi:O-antigen ligase